MYKYILSLVLGESVNFISTFKSSNVALFGLDVVAVYVSTILIDLFIWSILSNNVVLLPTCVVNLNVYVLFALYVYEPAHVLILNCIIEPYCGVKLYQVSGSKNSVPGPNIQFSPCKLQLTGQNL